MNFAYRTLGLLLAGLALASCGGGGGDGHGATTPAQSGKLTLTATTTTLPVNVWNYPPNQRNTPTQAEVTAVWRYADGTLVTGHDISASISPITVAGISCLADGDGCEELDVLYGTVPFKGTNGQSTFFVNSRSAAGTANLLVSAIDPITGRTVSASMMFTVTSGVGPMPGSIEINPNPAGIYMQGSSGNSNSLITTVVRDGAGQFVPNPASGNSGVDNLLFEIVGDSGGAKLSANSVSGPMSGNSVKTHTVNGQASVSFQSGTVQGPIQIRATADRSDNDVSNGISDPLSVTTSVVVSDGKLYSLEITSPLFAPALPGITINELPVSGNTIPPEDQGMIPPNPDATLSLVVSALATDRQGNPVIPGTAIRFGSVDEPVAPFNTSGGGNFFQLSGVDGDPKEGGNLFTAPGGHFRTAGGGAGPGDALIVFGKAVQGNEDLESAVTVTSVTSETSLNVSPGFNLNNTTGTSVNSGSVLPYLIGRSQHGNITAAARTNELGVASGRLTYTVNTVGHAVALWAQGDGVDRVTNGPRRVTDAVAITYPGVAPASIAASPNPILGNTTQTVTVCMADALGIPLRGFPTRFAFSNLAGGSGSVDGVNSNGRVSHTTDADGCVDAKVVTSGLSASAGQGNSGQITFSGAGAQATIDIVVNVALLQVSPNQVQVPAAGIASTLTITALTSEGGLVPGAVITGTCTASGGDSAKIEPASFTGTTDASGKVQATVNATGFVKAGTPPSVGTGQCTFTTDGSRSATVNFSGGATACDFSPQPPECSTP